jgi:6-phosphogluconolactonase
VPDIRVYANLEDLSRAAADVFQNTVAQCAQAERRAYIAVSGGSTPKRLYELLATPPWSQHIHWSCVELFWVDERPVPPDSPESNYRLVNDALLNDVPLPPTSVHSIPTELGSLDAAAAAYDAEMKEMLPRTADGWPRFDLVLLGMGDDGHTASLFPQSPAISETERWVVVNPVPKLHTERITLTFPVLNHAAQVVFLVSGAAKAEVLNDVLHAPFDVAALPAQGVRPEDGEVTWLVDEAAYALQDDE